MLTIASLVFLNFRFKKADVESVEVLLCNKLWVTNSASDDECKIIIEFKSNNTYEHRYILKDTLALYIGKWYIGKDKKIYIKFENTKTTDVYEIIELNNYKLEINTNSSGLKKLALKK
jgi:hypothetical protein